MAQCKAYLNIGALLFHVWTINEDGAGVRTDKWVGLHKTGWEKYKNYMPTKKSAQPKVSNHKTTHEQ